jgi:alpha-L-rhamnosidase
VKPQPGGGLTSASATHLTPYGRLSVSWSITAGVLSVELEVPAGASALVELPGREPFDVRSGSHRFSG